MKPNNAPRRRYLEFVDDYKHKRLDDKLDKDKPKLVAPVETESDNAKPKSFRERLPWKRGHRREYLREYMKWLRPHRYAVMTVAVLALMVAGLEMISPLFMRFIIDKVLL